MSEKDNFEKGIFWELYKDLERQFQNFLEYVPYLNGNENVYSFRLLNLILSIGGHVDSAFKEMARYPDFSSNEDCKEILERLEEKPPIIPIKLPLRAFEKEYNLSTREVIFKRLSQQESIAPFKRNNLKTNIPKWWNFYNELKHDVSLNIKKANLKNTCDALAGAFLLNAVHKPVASKLHELGVLKIPYVNSDVKFEVPVERMLTDGIVETTLFKFRHGDKCIKCDMIIPTASEKCQYCGMKQKVGV